ncbi:hypothetical protein [Microbacterium rhizosphaerae]|uniref:Siderophore-interacting protein n=1 Tax=Microbacterium rhizosphaerae TaxID=1678237 RepID=A0ABZ0SHT9_9MICO|nr:hypothetical protein [Microbacterium rhizosphaerae]WPR88314.1 hypothetical protein SM116_11020 [Microbacterium rhizosphaerae]
MTCREAAVAEAIRDSLGVGDRTRVERMLRRGVTLLVDGGGRVAAPSAPIVGRRAAAGALVELLTPTAASSSTMATVNGAPAIAFHEGARVVAVLALRLRGRRASDVWLVVNPDKLRHWNMP